MLARSSSDAGTRLRRSKSSSIAHRQIAPIPEPLDPAIAQQHAVAAATAAYARAHQSTVSERADLHTSNLDRTKSTSSRKSFSSQGSHFPPRGSSFRSTNPSQNSQTAMTHRQDQSMMSGENFPPYFPPADVERPLSTQPPIAFNENIRPGSQLNSHRRSAASSITSQQIRKARSMYYASSVQTGSPIARPPVRYLVSPLSTSTGPTVGPGPATHNRPSTPLPMASSQLPVEIAPGETIDKARDKYLQTFQQRQTKHKPSLFLAPFRKRQEKSKAKERPLSAGLVSISSTWRSNANDTIVESLDDFGMPKQKKEKRSISGSIKDKLKKVFRRTSSNATTLPVQHIDASRDYSSYTSTQREQYHIADRSSEVPSPENVTLTRIKSRTPALERPPSPFVRAASRSSNASAGSHRSLHSEQNLTHTTSSRVTSWNDSSASGTLTQREIKRLTVIHEAKDSIGSQADCASNLSPKRDHLPLSSSQDLDQPTLVDDMLHVSSTPVDPKRVFSALMKEIDASKAQQAPATASASDDSPGAESDIFASSTTKELHVVAPRDIHSSGSRSFRPSVSSDRRPPSYQRPGTAKSRASSIRSFGKALKSTIRTVTPHERKASVSTERAGSARGAVRIPQFSTATSSESDISESGHHEGHGHTINDTHIRLNPAGGQLFKSGLHAPHTLSPSTDQIERRVAKAKDRWKTQLDDHMSKPISHQERPYGVSNSNTISTPKTTTEISPSKRLEGESPMSREEQVTPVQTTHKSPRPRQLFSPLSPSVYSRNTDGMSILPNDSMISFEDTRYERGTRDGGSAVITTSHSVRSYAIGTPSPPNASDSTHSSRDWKAWLSHEVSELANDSRENIAIDESYIASARHRHELTQIDDDSATVMRASIDVPTPRQGPMRNATTELFHVNDARGNEQNDWLTGDTNTPVTPGRLKTHSNILPLRQSHTPSANRFSIKSGSSSTSHSTNGTPRSSRMNERFPFIFTDRRSSSYSAKLRRTSRTPTEGSSGSSMKSKALTPASKIYTDYSAPGTNRTILHESQTTLAKVEEVSNTQRLRKENVTPVSSSKLQANDQPKTPKLQFSPVNISRPRSMLPLSSTAVNRAPSTAAKYTTNQVDVSKTSPLSTSTISPLRRRSKVVLHPGSSEKTTIRPKSAIDLRGAKSPALVISHKADMQRTPDSTESKKSGSHKITIERDGTVSHKRASYRVSALDNETLRLLIESPWAVSGAPSPRTSLELPSQVLRARKKSHVSTPSSTLASNKEPSPGKEQRIIDSLLTAEVKPLDFSGNGRITPGQRMAERFLRERSAGRGSDCDGESASVREGSLMSEGKGGGKLDREDTPAFL